MSEISKILFLVSDSLLIPDIIVLLVLFVRALLLVGSFYNRFITKYKNDKQLKPSRRSHPKAQNNLKPYCPHAITLFTLNTCVIFLAIYPTRHITTI